MRISLFRKIIWIIPVVLIVLATSALAEEWAPSLPNDTGDEELPPSFDIDHDGVADGLDNCPNDYNPSQADSDNDGKGDACDSVDDRISDKGIDIAEVNVDVDGKEDKITSNNRKIGGTAKANSDVDFTVKVKNVYGKEIKDVDVEVAIQDIDKGDDVTEDTRISRIAAGDSKEANVKFELPSKVDAGDYDVSIHVEGVDEDDNTHSIDWELQLKVDKEKDNVEIEASITPNPVSCGELANLNLNIANLGKSTENVEIRIINAEMGLNLNEKNVQIDSDDEYDKSYKLRIAENMVEGTYPVNVKVYYNNGKLSRSKDIEFIIENCNQIKETKNVETLKVVKTNQVATTNMIQKPTAELSFFTEDNAIILILIFFILILGGLAVFLVGVFIRLRK